MEEEPHFREVQRFHQPWIWALLGGVSLLMIAFGPISWGGLVVVSAVAILLFSLRLETEVRADGIYLQMWPLHRSVRRIPWSEIKRYESTQYSPVREFGGWGIRWTPGKLAYNVSGERGIRIELTSGRVLLVGSQRPEDLVRTIDGAAQ